MNLPSIVRDLVNGGSLAGHDGVVTIDTHGKLVGVVAAPLDDLDAVPFPDYADFPWERYPNRIVPVITGRGCGWGACTFCSDITSTAGRSYRSRSPENVMAEIAHHASTLNVKRFVFTDLKLNSNIGMWNHLSDRMQEVVPGARWIGAIHAAASGDNGLSEAELQKTARSGCVRLTTGLETASQRVADLMKKGTTVNHISTFLKNATSAGISTRCTMIIGYPGETADDVQASADFLARNADSIERISINRLAVIDGTSLQKNIERHPERFNGFLTTKHNPAQAIREYSNDGLYSKQHRRAVLRLLNEAHNINCRPLADAAADFEGVM
jgi:radical SAM superfamily enzyme YgiQ (UPF0313 family)